MADDLDTDSVVFHLPLDVRIKHSRLSPCPRTAIDYVPAEHSSLTSSPLSSSSDWNSDTFDRSNGSDDDLFGNGSRNIFSNPENDADNEDDVASLAKDVDRKLVLGNPKNFGDGVAPLLSPFKLNCLTYTRHSGAPCENSDLPEHEKEVGLVSGSNASGRTGKPDENPEIPEDQVEVDLITKSNIENPSTEEIIKIFNSFAIEDDNLTSKGRVSHNERREDPKNVYKGKDLGIRKEYQNTGPPVKQCMKHQFQNSHVSRPPSNDYINTTYTCLPPPIIIGGQQTPHSVTVPVMRAQPCQQGLFGLDPKDIDDFLERYPVGQEGNPVGPNVLHPRYPPNQPTSPLNSNEPLPSISSFRKRRIGPNEVATSFNPCNSPFPGHFSAVNSPGQNHNSVSGQMPKYDLSHQAPSQNMNSTASWQNVSNTLYTRGNRPLQNVNIGTNVVTSRQNINREPSRVNPLFEKRSTEVRKGQEQNLPLVIFEAQYRDTPSTSSSPSHSECTPLSPARSFTSSDSSPFHEYSSDMSSRSSVCSPASSNDALTTSSLNEMNLNEGDASPLDGDSDTESEYDNGNNELHELAFQTDEAQMKETIESLDDLSSKLHEKNRNGQTPLYYCVQHGNVTAVEILLSYRSNPKIRCYRKDSRKIDNYFIENALHVACEKGYTKIVQLLLGRCRDADFVNSKRSGDAFTPFMLALTEHGVRQDRTDVIDELLKYEIELSTIDRKTGRNSLMIAIKKRALDVADQMLDSIDVIEQRAHVTCADYSGNTCLHMLAEIATSDDLPSLTRDQIRRFVLKLTRCGADVNARNNENLTAKDYCHDLMMQIGIRH